MRKRYLNAQDPRLQELQCKVSTHLYNEGKYDEALDNCQHIAHDSNDTFIKRKALCIVGKICAKKLDKVGCIAAFEEALKLAEQKGDINLDLSATFELYGQAKFQLGLFDESIDCFHDAYRIRADDDEATDEEFQSLTRSIKEAHAMIQQDKKYIVFLFMHNIFRISIQWRKLDLQLKLQDKLSTSM